MPSQVQGDERAFSFLRLNDRQSKPRTRGVTEIRGPYYTPMGKRYLQDILETLLQPDAAPGGQGAA
jgi:phosphosulfolactate synthase (CoM biosynthesis protein A)